MFRPSCQRSQATPQFAFHNQNAYSGPRWGLLEAAPRQAGDQIVPRCGDTRPISAAKPQELAQCPCQAGAFRLY